MKQSTYNFRYNIRYKMVLYLPYIAFMIIFAIVFGLVGLLIDNKIYSDYFGRSSLDAFIFSAMIGIFVSWIFTWFIRKPIYKFILKKNYDDRRFIKIMNEKSSPTGVLIFSCVLIVATCILIFMFGCFNGFAFDNDGNVYYKETPFSQNEVVAIDDVEIAIIKNRHGRYNTHIEYHDTAYAFKFGDEWIAYGVPNDEKSKNLILNSIEENNKIVNTYFCIEELKNENFRD